MRGGSVAKRYATALVGVAQELGKLDPFYQELRGILEEFRNHPDLKTTFESPVVPPSQKKALFSALSKKFGVSPEIGNLMQILIDQDRVAILPLLVELYRDRTDETLGRVRVQVSVAADLGPAEETLKNILEKTLGKKVLLESTVDPELLGGMRVRVQDRVFDGSIKRGLEKLKESIVEKVVA